MPGRSGVGALASQLWALGCAWRLSVVRGRKRRFWRAHSPCARISRATRFLPQRSPSSRTKGEHARAAIGAAAARKAPGDQGRELGIALAARSLRLASVRVKAAPADLKRLGQGTHRIVGVELLHHREALRGISADKMPKAFFRISRCWRR